MNALDALRGLPRPAIAGLLAVLVTGYVLAGVAWNRRLPADATVTLTERELPTGWQGEEDTGIELRLSWQEAIKEGKRDWLDQAKLETLGFEFPVPLDDEAAELYYADLLPRRSWAVLEYEGDAWREYLEAQKRELEDLRDRIRRGKEAPDQEKIMLKNQADYRISGSRLFLVDVGPDAAALRLLYADRARFIVSPVLVSASYYRPWDYEKQVQGPARISGGADLLNETIHVPRAHRAVLDRVRRADEERRKKWEADPKIRTDTAGTWFDPTRPPAYAVTMPYGRRFEPWVEKIELLQMPETGPAAVTAPGAGTSPG